ncbi:MAG: BamA/TamA family outer membrane protein [Bacteroidales bacterium]|nr:BamA/TamA family outer membrane protein [Bacteroidales bacterium]
MNRGKLISAICCVLALSACSTTRSLKSGEFLLRKNTVEVNEESFNASSLSSYLAQKPNSYVLGTNPLLSVYNWAGQSESGFANFLRSLGTKPVVYDPAKVEESIASMENHLHYIGYYGSHVDSEVSVKGKKVYVNYYVTLGRRFEISSIEYDIPSYGTFREDFRADSTNILVKTGSLLSGKTLEEEADRSALYFRNLGYYGFSRSFFAFEADTLASDGKARLKYSILDYALGEDPETAREHKKFSIGDVSFSYAKDLKLRPGMLEGLNLLRPGQPYSDQAINTTYTRLTNVAMFNGVNVNVSPVAEDRVDCNISLRSGGLQGFKTNLEASVNSTGLIGISPQLSYYHKNIFHGGEVLNLGLKGNFQFKPNDNVSSTEFSLTSSIRFPRFIFFPMSRFKGPYVPRTDISLAFNYQDRPEFQRTVISSAFTYNGRLSERLFYQFSPARANIARVFDVDESFLNQFIDNIFMLQMFADNFDLGWSAMLYYTTDASAIPARSYHYWRLSADVAGNILSMFNSALPQNDRGQYTVWDIPYAQYVRGELQLGQTFRFGKNDRHALALRFLAGGVYTYGNSTMPLDKTFYCGGSTSMRGWQARTLGPGNDTSLADFFIIPTQIGLMKFEANAEYRFPLFWKFEGAAFVDAGNVWDYATTEEEKDDPDVFNFKTLPESFGMNWGVGLRLNFDLILLRVDAGFRLHDPGRAEGERWVGPDGWFKRNGFAIHFGVGYPF